MTTVLTVFTTVIAPLANAAPAAKHFGRDIEVYAPYQGQTLCDPVTKPGVAKYRDLILKTYPGTRNSGTTRACSQGGKSEHKEGRAWDWGVNSTSSSDVAKVNDLFKWLFATDSYGNKDANVRRLGIMYIIWNKKSWHAGRGGWGAYSCSGTTDCHQDHVHFSFGWAGALAKTSYWTGIVSPVLDPPGTPVTFPKTVTIDPLRTTATTTGFNLTAGRHYKLTVSGTYHYGPGSMIADAECNRWAYSATWRRWSRAEGDPGHNDLDLSVGGHATWQPVIDTGGRCNLQDHRYTMAYNPSKTGPLSFIVNGTKRGSSSSPLSVTVTTA